MMRRLLSITAGVSLLALVHGTHFAGGEADSAASIPLFERVAPGLYRGGQPTLAGLGFLKWRGIRTVVNLREELDERPLVEKLGFKYVHIPLDVGEPVSDQARQKFFDVVNDPANQPVFVHCRRGADRTGVMIGFYRIAVEGWDAGRAYKEARMLGMRWWYRGLKRQLYDFAERCGLARGLLRGKQQLGG